MADKCTLRIISENVYRVKFSVIPSPGQLSDAPEFQASSVYGYNTVSCKVKDHSLQRSGCWSLDGYCWKVHLQSLQPYLGISMQNKCTISRVNIFYPLQAVTWFIFHPAHIIVNAAVSRSLQGTLPC